VPKCRNAKEWKCNSAVEREQGDLHVQVLKGHHAQRAAKQAHTATIRTFYQVLRNGKTLRNENATRKEACQAIRTSLRDSDRFANLFFQIESLSNRTSSWAFLLLLS
jgi:hypothetical protein